jgi:hypothetical protein
LPTLKQGCCLLPAIGRNGFFAPFSYAGQGTVELMVGKKADGHEAALLRGRCSFLDAGRVLRRAYDPALASPTDPKTDALMKLLLETSPHDMASC